MHHTAARAEFRPSSLVKVDGRTKGARYAKQLRAELLRHVGPAPSPVQEALIALAVDLGVQLQLIRWRLLPDGSMIDADRDVFLDLSRVYAETIERLGAQSAPGRAA